tara:strand:- start:1760 stop:2218 length:459 start_codon:yes stop_codon:yes gene_type:complete
VNILDQHPWRNLGGEAIEDIRDYIKQYSLSRYTLHIGTDTKPMANDVTLISTICFREKGKGALVAYQKSKTKVFPTIRDRLFHETFISLEIAAELWSLTGVRPTIHADINPKKDTLSNTTLDAIIGMIKGLGYPVLVKPEAWAADIADMYTR